ncbi:hypothetical protein DFH08DRAFT_976457 [Mycena albidolilacea]|uniref:F-box domain-containing protein n=1 Tax=Mycena albidolilacea TaxID=1033008 RepID=A0AAD7E9M5_9AGAR|nr:hypothetical protein DFH08DRAFT_976457 [Mycena albidolilacea]
MGLREQVPNELWLEIFRSLPPDALKNLSLTYTKFKGISRPLLFNEFHFHPYASGQRDDILLPGPTEVNQSMERLEFWCSDEIAPNVRSCTMTPWRKLGPVWSSWNFAATSTPYILLVPFFERLRAFTCLQELSAYGIRFTQSGVTNLCRASALTNLRLENCSITIGEHIDTSSLSLGVARFAFHHMVTGAAGNGDVWLPLLRPECLQELDLTLNPSLFGDEISIPSFPHVHTFTTTMNLSTMSYNLSILAKFPAVRTFSTHGWGQLQDGPDVLAEASFTFLGLQQYTGPCETMALFLHRPTLTHLTIGYCSPFALITQLERIGGSNNITSLTASFDNLDIAMLGTICAFFPTLTELRIDATSQVEYNVADDTQGATGFFTELAEITTLPTALERLGLTCVFEYDDPETAPPAADVPEFSELRDALVARYPSLTALWFDGQDFLFHWRKLLDGSEVEDTAEDAGEYISESHYFPLL